MDYIFLHYQTLICMKNEDLVVSNVYCTRVFNAREVIQHIYTYNTALVIYYLSKLMAHKLNIDAVHKRMSNDIHMSHKIQPTCHEPAMKWNENVRFLINNF